MAMHIWYMWKQNEREFFLNWQHSKCQFTILLCCPEIGILCFLNWFGRHVMDSIQSHSWGYKYSSRQRILQSPNDYVLYPLKISMFPTQPAPLRPTRHCPSYENLKRTSIRGILNRINDLPESIHTTITVYTTIEWQVFCLTIFNFVF